jgi:hypothetical protein
LKGGDCWGVTGGRFEREVHWRNHHRRVVTQGKKALERGEIVGVRRQSLALGSVMF